MTSQRLAKRKTFIGQAGDGVINCPPFLEKFMEEENSLIEQRKANLDALRDKGIEPFANKFTPNETCAGARENYQEGREASLAGRMTAFRTMGKSIFLDIRDGSDRMQVYAQKNTLGEEAFEVLKKLDLGDFLQSHALAPARSLVKVRALLTLGFCINPSVSHAAPPQPYAANNRQCHKSQRCVDNDPTHTDEHNCSHAKVEHHCTRLRGSK